MDRYTVWIGGIEASQYYLYQAEAKALAKQCIAEGYTDVYIEKVYVLLT